MSRTAASLELPFTARERDGTVVVKLWANDDPVETGHAMIAADFDEQAFKGFPVVIAEVRYPVVGPRAIFYWLQTVAHELSDGSCASEVDSIHGPFYAVGHTPTFMDAPANPGHPDMRWVARTFLASDPRVLRSRVLDPVVGFRWGYQIAGGRPQGLFGPERATMRDWAHMAATYRREYPDWTLVG